MQIKEVCRLGETLDGCLVLSQYTEEVKAVFSIESGVYLEEWELTEIGDVQLKNKKEKQGTDFLVTYVVAIPPIDEREVNTVDGLTRVLQENPDIEILDKIRKWRKILSKKYNVQLQGFVVWNSVYLDEFGQLLSVTYANQKRRESINKTRPVIQLDDFVYEVFGDDLNVAGVPDLPSVFAEFNVVPRVSSVCGHCGQGWTLDTLRDVVQTGSTLYHSKCKEYAKNEITLTDFPNIVQQVLGIDCSQGLTLDTLQELRNTDSEEYQCKFKKYVQDRIALVSFQYVAQSVFDADIQLIPIRNEYGSWEDRGCWFILHTEYGSIKIGWRWRVIRLEWLPNYVEFDTSVFKTEKVTQEFSKKLRMIHADSVLDAIMYLQKAKDSHI